MHAARRYDPLPCYPSVGGEVRQGWPALCAQLPAEGAILSIDGPAVLDWDALVSAVTGELSGRGGTLAFVDVRSEMAAWDQVVKRTAPAEQLADDPDFATIPQIALSDLFDEMPAPPRATGQVVLVFGPGAALVGHDLLWYADLPKRYAEAAVGIGGGTNLGQRPGDGPPTTRRLFYIDWPLLDRHRDVIAADVDCWVDTQSVDSPRWITGAALRATLPLLASRPFRTRPTFNTTSWGGHWAQQELGFNQQARNTALGYELIAPESGILIGESPELAVEVPFQLLVSSHPAAVMGDAVRADFGTSFPIRFDYLDTVGGGSLSVHCHPRDNDMRDVFGWPYTQHETYYVMVGGHDHVVYLGLREDADVEAFEDKAHHANDHAAAFDIEEFVQTFPADQHQLFLIPAGTPHGSGMGNVVLEVSATPYLYSLRFYDWLRRDADGGQRPVHVDHAFRNLNPERRGDAVRQDLIQPARVIDSGAGWMVELIGRLPEMFFDVQRLVLEPFATAGQHTGGRFHVLNLVEGEAVTIRVEDEAGGWSEHPLSYAETIVIPAAVGEYEVVSGHTAVRLVRAVVR